MSRERERERERERPGSGRRVVNSILIGQEEVSDWYANRAVSVENQWPVHSRMEEQEEEEEEEEEEEGEEERRRGKGETRRELGMQMRD